jgi:SAM-dependent methyltransferase
MNAATNADMIEFWNGDAGQKWVQFQDLMDRSLRPLGRAAMDVAAPKAGERVIDVGCGCGDTTFDLARRVGPEGHVLGVDISQPMLARAKSRMGACANVTFERGDAQVFEFSKSAFDIVFSRFGVMFFDDPVAVFRNLRAALKPGGRVALMGWRAARENAWVKVPVGIVGAHVPMPPRPDPDAPGEFAFADDARVRRILTEAGFAAVDIARHDAPISLAGGGLEDTVALLLEFGPTGRAVADAGADAALKARIAADLRDGLRPHLTPAGVVLGTSTWVVTARAP